jgi:hypothetical protein
MIEITIKQGMFIVNLPTDPSADPIREALNMYDEAIFCNASSIVNDRKATRIDAYNPTGDFIRFAESNRTYELNPYLVSLLKDKNDAPIPPTNGQFYTTQDILNAFKANFI